MLQKLDPNLICCILLMENGKDFNDPLLERQIIVLFKNIQFYDVTKTKFMLTSSIFKKNRIFFSKNGSNLLILTFFHGLYVLLVIIVILANVSINIIHTMSIKHRFWEDLA